MTVRHGKGLGLVKHFDPKNLDYRIADVITPDAVTTAAVRGAHQVTRLVATQPDHPFNDTRTPRADLPAGHGPLLKYHNDAALWVDQGDTSWCTWASTEHVLADGPVTHPEERHTTMFDGAEFYAAEQEIDRREHGLSLGPDDGATSLACAKLLQRRGRIGEYRWGFTLDEFVAGLLISPLLAGVEWRTGMDDPEPGTGIIRFRGAVRGGHQIDANGIDLARGFARFKQSWRRDLYGRNGHAYMPLEDVEQMIAAQADILMFREMKTPKGGFPTFGIPAA